MNFDLVVVIGRVNFNQSMRQPVGLLHGCAHGHSGGHGDDHGGGHDDCQS